MTLVATGFIDPKDYPFKKFIDEQKHLDTDELRHSIKNVSHHIETDFKGQEHLFCDKNQLDVNGKWRRPKIMTQAEQRGFKTSIDMIEADKKAEEDTKATTISALQNQLLAMQTDNQNLHSALNNLITQVNNLTTKNKI